MIFHFQKDEIHKILPEILRLCTVEPQVKIAVKFLKTVSEKKKFVIDLFEDVIFNQQDGIDVVYSVMKNDLELSVDLLKKCIEFSDKDLTPKCVHQIRKIIESSAEIVPMQLVLEGIIASINKEYPHTAAGKKKCEAALEWALTLTRKFPSDFPRNQFVLMAPSIASLGSREASNMIRRLALLGV